MSEQKQPFNLLLVTGYCTSFSKTSGDFSKEDVQLPCAETRSAVLIEPEGVTTFTEFSSFKRFLSISTKLESFLDNFILLSS